MKKGSFIKIPKKAVYQNYEKYSKKTKDENQ